MRVKVLSDTHGNHHQEPIDAVDLLIHCGDATNYRDLERNLLELADFSEWWNEYPAKYKVFVPGNHDTSFSEKLRSARGRFESNTTVLIDDVVEIEGLSIFGSPFTPSFGNWSFMADRTKMHKHFTKLVPGIDIVITHGPPKTVLDLGTRVMVDSRGIDNRYLEFCGDSSLLNHVYRANPMFHFFGHIHGNNDFENNGMLRRENCNTLFANCSQVIDGQMGKLAYIGKIFEI